jgi:hypothetical protein
VSVHFVTPQQAPDSPGPFIKIDGIRTDSLANLITMKLRSGLAKLARAQDLADVIALIRVHGLADEFASKIPRDLRPEFCKLVEAVETETER